MFHGLYSFEIKLELVLIPDPVEVKILVKTTQLLTLYTTLCV